MESKLTVSRTLRSDFGSVDDRGRGELLGLERLLLKSTDWNDALEDFRRISLGLASSRLSPSVEYRLVLLVWLVSLCFAGALEPTTVVQSYLLRFSVKLSIMRATQSFSCAFGGSDSRCRFLSDLFGRWRSRCNL